MGEGEFLSLPGIPGRLEGRCAHESSPGFSQSGRKTSNIPHAAQNEILAWGLALDFRLSPDTRTRSGSGPQGKSTCEPSPAKDRSPSPDC